DPKDEGGRFAIAVLLKADLAVVVEFHHFQGARLLFAVAAQHGAVVLLVAAAAVAAGKLFRLICHGALTVSFPSHVRRTFIEQPILQRIRDGCILLSFMIADRLSFHKAFQISFAVLYWTYLHKEVIGCDFPPKAGTACA